MEYYIGTDTGGTFTDCVVIDSRGKITIAKSPSTPKNFADGLMDVLQAAARNRDLEIDDLVSASRTFMHGCTVATNTLINHNGARVGTITTRGFEDTLQVMRASGTAQGLPVEAWYHKGQNPKPFDMVRPGCVRGVTERIDRKGAEVVALNAGEVESAARYLVEEMGCEAISVCFLWSFISNGHEVRAREIVKDLYPDVYVDCSHEVVGLIGEYERFSTTAMNSYLRPEVEAYVTDLGGRLKDKGMAAELLMMQASGGCLPGLEAARHAVSIVGSGPTGGVLAGKIIGDLIGKENIITTDMGGTSFDISIIARGEICFTRKSFHERHAVGVPMAEIVSIGAGGGSIAHVDEGIMKVGPTSAGMDPGPVCYRKGGVEPTVTDANIVLGFLNPDYFLGGEMTLDKEAAERAIEEKLAGPLGISVKEAAAGIFKIVNAHMADATRFHALQHGFDPRDFTVLAFGGAGPVHAAGFGEEMGARSVIVPLAGLSTVLSAFGICNSNVVRFYFSSMGMPFPPEELAELNSIYEEMEEKGKKDVSAYGFTSDEIGVLRSAGMRYHLQLTDIDVPIPPGTIDGEMADRIMESFDTRYAELYGETAGFKEAGRDMISEFVRVIGKTLKGKVEAADLAGPDPAAALKGTREVFFPQVESVTSAAIYDGDALVSGNVVEGPAILEMIGTTVVVSPGYSARYDEFRNVHLEKA